MIFSALGELILQLKLLQNYHYPTFQQSYFDIIQGKWSWVERTSIAPPFLKLRSNPVYVK